MVILNNKLESFAAENNILKNQLEAIQTISNQQANEIKQLREKKSIQVNQKREKTSTSIQQKSYFSKFLEKLSVPKFSTPSSLLAQGSLATLGFGLCLSAYYLYGR